ncbi:hypothetical protein AB1K91_17735 [Terribacillus sp. 179-K 1B1 HS]|uniref:hypothetical protein n=1 Tax=Terribacillus sp. 179-K 1B1 HS TaxID=3142388 RepID=UPI0039A1F19D
MKELTEKRIINDLVLLYQKERNEIHFNEVYRYASGKLKKTLESVSRRHRIDRSDLHAAFDDAILSSVENYKEGSDYENLLMFSAKNKIRDRIRRTSTLEKYFTFIESFEEESDAATFDRLHYSQGSTERSSEDIYEEKEKELNQRQLIKSLIESAENDLPAKVVKIVLRESSYSPTAIGAELGILKQSVPKQLAKLKKAYNPSKFGPLADLMHA